MKYILLVFILISFVNICGAQSPHICIKKGKESKIKVVFKERYPINTSRKNPKDGIYRVTVNISKIEGACSDNGNSIIDNDTLNCGNNCYLIDSFRARRYLFKPKPFLTYTSIKKVFYDDKTLFCERLKKCFTP